jgi:hypothetical protein
MGYSPPKHRFLNEPHGARFQKIAFIIATAVKTSDLNIALTGGAL